MRKRNKETVSINLEFDHIAKMLDNNIADGPNKELVSDAIVQIVADHGALDLLTKAMLGLKPDLKYSVGDEVMIKYNCLSDWQFDIPAMEQKAIILNDLMKCKIIEASPWRTYKYKVSYEFISKDDGSMKTGTSDPSDSYIKGLAEEFPEDL